MSELKAPKITNDQLRAIAQHCGFPATAGAVVIGIRGYFLDSVGAANRNDQNVWDDVIAWVSPRAGAAFAGNTDPSFTIDGKGKALAKLNLGVYTFVKGKHKKIAYAFRAYPEGVSLPCTRNGKSSSCSFINIHPGGVGTWSEGCQTLPPRNWTKFQPAVYAEMTNYGQKTIPYILIENREVNGKQAFYDAKGQVINL